MMLVFFSAKLKKDNLVDRASSVQRGTQKRYKETFGYNWIGEDESMDLATHTRCYSCQYTDFENKSIFSLKA
jgi:hypothetical protein